MDEREWRSSTDPQAMLAFVRQQGMLTERKARLFAAAFCRCIWQLLSDERCQKLVEVAEQFAEGIVTQEELEAAIQMSNVFTNGVHARENWPYDAPLALTCSARPENLVLGLEEAFRSIGAAGQIAQCLLIHDLFGRFPFRPVSLPASVMIWSQGLVRRLAEEVYKHRLLPSGQLDLDRLDVLADALEEAGADDTLIAHLRDPGPHYMGCHIIDLLTGRS